MPDANVEKLHAWLRDHEQDLLNDFRAMLRIPSIESEPLPNAPYGQANRDALDFALKLSSEAGMVTHDLEGHIGYADFGSGARLVMSLGHLDVVPVGPGWKHEPFGAEIDGDYVYARGATDDKGPTMASFHAMRAIKECLPNLNTRFRQVFGCNEESGFGCVERYMQTEEAPTFGVAPDSGWPLIHAEKGIMDLIVTAQLPEGEFQVLEITGGQRPNIVIDSCVARVRVAESARKHVDEKLADSWDANVSFAWDGDVLTVTGKGKAAHGSRPYTGDSAAIRVLRFLREISPLSSLEFIDNLFDFGHISGAGLGIHRADEPSADLTSNLGIVTTLNGAVEMLFNIRYPVTTKGGELAETCAAYLAKLGGPFSVRVDRDSPPLYFPLDHPLVKTICEVVAEETGETREPGVMGGGTYARAVPNTVSIGTSWPGDGLAHETDERFKVEHLFRASRIYAHILYRLATIPQ